jgi:hypothetical protein
LRPVREAGTRIELEKINGVWTVHNYGAGEYLSNHKPEGTTDTDMHRWCRLPILLRLFRGSSKVG